MILIHCLAAIIASLCVATFFCTTVLVELFGSTMAIEAAKRLIVWPGLFVLVPSIVVAGSSGFVLAKTKGNRGGLIQNKKKRMPFIALNGLLVLVPCALLLDSWASNGGLGTRFYIVQLIELIAGAINLLLLGKNMRDGFRLTNRFRN